MLEYRNKLPKSVLIIRPGALGDTLMLMPSIAGLGTSAEITFAGRSPGLFYLRPYVHGTMDYEGPGWHTLFQEEEPSRPGFFLPPFDLAIAFLSDPEGKVKKNLPLLLPETPVHIFAPFPSKGTEDHVALYLARCIKEAGLPINPENCLGNATREALLEKESGLLRSGTVVLHPGSGSEAKNHSPAFWLNLIREWMRRLGGNRHLILLFGPAEEGLYAFFKDHIDTVGIEEKTFPERRELISLLGRARLYIGHDSGITHLAAMLGTPSIALFKNSSSKQWRPLGPFVSTIEDEDSDNELIRKVLREAEKLRAIACGKH